MNGMFLWHVAWICKISDGGCRRALTRGDNEPCCGFVTAHAQRHEHACAKAWPGQGVEHSLLPQSGSRSHLPMDPTQPSNAYASSVALHARASRLAHRWRRAGGRRGPPPVPGRAPPGSIVRPKLAAAAPAVCTTGAGEVVGAAGRWLVGEGAVSHEAAADGAACGT